jgi:hypothetical protein
MLYVSTRSPQRIVGREPDEFEDKPWERGLGPWIQRNAYLLARLFVVLVFTFGASTTAANFSYGLQGDPVRLTAEQLNRGELPAGVEIGDYVEVVGTPDVPSSLDGLRIGEPESRIAVSARYSTTYMYFGLKETGDNFLLQTIEAVPETGTGPRLWQGQLQNVGTVIFHDTTQRGLTNAGLPTDEAIPVITTGDTPEYYRTIFPAYMAIIGLWVFSIAWLVWKRNRPFLGL